MGASENGLFANGYTEEDIVTILASKLAGICGNCGIVLASSVRRVMPP